jgi:hypothetical protein
MIRTNLESTGVADRATVVQGAIGLGVDQRIGYTLARIPFADGVHRYVGAPVADDYEGESTIANVIPLSALVTMLGGSVDLGKIDCEGCEWVALADPYAAKVARWVGEYHGDPGPDGLEAFLGESFDLTVEPHDHGATGLFVAVRR